MDRIRENCFLYEQLEAFGSLICNETGSHCILLGLRDNARPVTVNCQTFFDIEDKNAAARSNVMLHGTILLLPWITCIIKEVEETSYAEIFLAVRMKDDDHNYLVNVKQEYDADAIRAEIIHLF
eukprot:14757691-Ditylum_brightwellii.AAC.1